MILQIVGFFRIFGRFIMSKVRSNNNISTENRLNSWLLRIFMALAAIVIMISAVWFWVGVFNGYLIFGDRGNRKIRHLIMQDRGSVIDVRERDKIIDYYLKENIDEDFTLSSNDVFHLYKSLGLQD